MRRHIASPFTPPSSPFWFSKFQLCCRKEKKGKNWKWGLWKETTGGNSVSASCSVHFKMEMLYSLNCPLSKQYRETRWIFRKAGGRRRGWLERRRNEGIVFKGDYKMFNQGKENACTDFTEEWSASFQYWQLAVTSLLQPHKTLLVSDKTVVSLGNGTTSRQWV